MKSVMVGVLALIAFAAIAPVASADGGTLVVDNTELAVNSYTLTSNHLNVSLNSNLAADWFFFLDQLTGADINNLELIANGSTFNLHGGHVDGFGLSGSPSGIISDVDFVYLNSSTVPEPATFVLLACGLAGLAFFARRKLLLS
jgi:hypothetical protein